MEPTTAAVEAPTTTKSTAMEAASAAHAASVSTAAATSVTAATTTAAATSECRSWLTQADRCQCEQGYNRFPHHVFPPLDEVALKAYNTFAAGLFGDRQRSQ
ncbi:hypothetical protein [Bradyrhizobium erythrophlei]|uniref:Uncharacterized protein n=1 Tax=Bradyrhizobium erythrophlei TaxID=1437360 RepID=A0A1M5PYS4_9BRAD|nr:hypothetical protein [Bradyrhizobium erythrophlei]SHH07055.1 hypothetical protein SAMN05444169_5579 [Bradyrhizobium erythrophlei]